MAGSNIKINRQAFLRKVESNLTPSLRRGLQRISSQRACFGIKENEELAMIMAVLNYGDPEHTFRNTKKGSARRATIAQTLAEGGENKSALPARPWLDNSTRGFYQRFLTEYINENSNNLIRGIIKRGRTVRSESTKRSITEKEFMEGLAEAGRKNAVHSWNYGHFEPNSKVTLAKKSDPRPLHDTGAMNEDQIEGWVE